MISLHDGELGGCVASVRSLVGCIVRDDHESTIKITRGLPGKSPGGMGYVKFMPGLALERDAARSDQGEDVFE